MRIAQHSWLDAGLYLAKKKSGILLTVEHRSAPAPEPMSLTLVTGSDGTARMDVSDADPGARRGEADDLADRALKEIAKAGEPITRSALRARLGIRNERLGRVLTALEESRRIERRIGGWSVRRTKGNATDPTPELPFD